MKLLILLLLLPSLYLFFRLRHRIHSIGDEAFRTFFKHGDECEDHCRTQGFVYRGGESGEEVGCIFGEGEVGRACPPVGEGEGEVGGDGGVRGWVGCCEEEGWGEGGVIFEGG